MTNSGSNDSNAAFKPLDYKKLAVRFVFSLPTLIKNTLPLWLVNALMCISRNTKFHITLCRIAHVAIAPACFFVLHTTVIKWDLKGYCQDIPPVWWWLAVSLLSTRREWPVSKPTMIMSLCGTNCGTSHLEPTQHYSSRRTYAKLEVYWSHVNPWKEDMNFMST